MKNKVEWNKNSRHESIADEKIELVKKKGEPK